MRCMVVFLARSLLNLKLRKCLIGVLVEEGSETLAGGIEPPALISCLLPQIFACMAENLVFNRLNTIMLEQESFHDPGISA